MGKIIVSGSFDNMTSLNIRFLDEASKNGPLKAFLWSDETIKSITGEYPKFPLKERLYYMNALRYVDEVKVVENNFDPETIPDTMDVDAWVVSEKDASPSISSFCSKEGITCKIIKDNDLTGFPAPDYTNSTESGNKKVLVTGCYDWFHTGHIRFFEEVSELGDLYVCIGNDANIEHLKGAGHPLFKEDERRYIVNSIRYVTQVHINSGMGWLDAEPEIIKIKPDIYAVNEDGDKPEKKEYCEANSIEYVILKRTPAPGLEKRESTALRGF
jgi:cytidyltransferase-like protein